MYKTWTDASTNCCFTITAQWFCQQSCKLWISEWHKIKWFIWSKSWNAIGKCSNRLIDIFSFL